MSDSSHDTRTLNSLVASLIDSVDGYTESAKDVESQQYRELFTARASERRQCADGLRSTVSRLGGNPEDDGTVLAAGHRAFVNLKSAVTGKDDKAVIAEVERGEDHLKSKFESALNDGDLSSDACQAIESAWASVKSGHDEMSQLKHSLESRA